MATVQQRLVFKDPASAEADVFDHHARARWRFEERIAPDPARSIPLELVFRTADGKVTLHFVDDHLVKFPYLVVKGEAADVEREVAAARQALKFHSEDEVLDYARRADTRAQKMESLAFVGVTAPQTHDTRYLEALKRGMEDADASVRKSAVWMSGYPAWPELRPLLEKVAEEDPDESVRNGTRSILAGFDHEGIGKKS